MNFDGYSLTMSAALKKAAALLPVLAAALLLKHHYSVASLEALHWIMAPTAALVHLVSELAFVYEAGVGYASAGHEFIIAKACAGVNFMIVAFCMAGATLVPASRSIAGGAARLCTCMALSYVATLAVNTVRIALSIRLYRAAIYGSVITPEVVHRIAGIVVYLVALLLLYMVCRAFSKGKIGDGSRSPSKTVRPGSFRLAGYCAIPLFWYAMMTVIVPFVNGARSASFYHHAAWVIVVSCMITGIFFGSGLLAPSLSRIGAGGGWSNGGILRRRRLLRRS
jgi:exosortase K